MLTVVLSLYSYTTGAFELFNILVGDKLHDT